MVASLQSLPVELRLQIWDHYVRASDLNIHQPRRFRRGVQRHLLAILQTCQTFRLEALSILTLDKFCFHCASTESLLDLFSKLSRMQLSSIRHLTVRDIPFDFEGDFFFWHDFFPLCPGLQLDTLTILDGGSSIERQDSAVSSSRVFPENRNHPLGLPSSSNETTALRGAKVDIFVAKKDYLGQKGVILDPEKRDVFDNNATDWIRPRPRLQRREMMVILQRGKDAYIVEDGSGLKSSVSELFEDRSWQVIKEDALRWRVVCESGSPRLYPSKNGQDAFRDMNRGILRQS
ncbi:hypothetical protein BLS_007741 [Venturia inaequalis]|uniref:Uncharacterized protein n=1 Tax=Venturia inaequalis TaxID=5025 RepID=A0A8H3U8X6_VENIN|nr:hypothetical protein BLS_007741 [Venturia inaequalis]